MNDNKVTPKELIDCLKSVNHKAFDQENDSLTNFVSQISKHYYCPYSAESTGKNRTIQVYRCRFGGRVRGKSYKVSCSSFVKFTLEKDGTYSFHSGDWNHNHPVELVYCNAHCNTLSQKEIESIKEQQRLNVLPGQIRSNLNISVSSNIYYEIRRETIMEMKHEDLNKFKESINYHDFLPQIKISKKKGTLSYANFLQYTVAKAPYSLDSFYIDDTMCTNIYNLPLECIICIDAESKSQLLAFSLLKDQTSKSYFQFFTFVKNNLGNDPRIITVDRSPAQHGAIISVFPMSIIVFCRCHIRRDLLKYFSSNDDIVVGFDDIAINIYSCDEYVELLKERLDTPR